MFQFCWEKLPTWFKTRLADTNLYKVIESLLENSKSVSVHKFASKVITQEVEYICRQRHWGHAWQYTDHVARQYPAVKMGNKLWEKRLGKSIHYKHSNLIILVLFSLSLAMKSASVITTERFCFRFFFPFIDDLYWFPISGHSRFFCAEIQLRWNFSLQSKNWWADDVRAQLDVKAI